jgi:hypothetical protein
MRIYIAARFDRRAEMAVLARHLHQAGHFVTSTWVQSRDGRLPDVVCAITDLDDLAAAECLVSFTEEPTEHVPWAARGGRHVEFGYALAAGKRLCLVGPRENVFHHLPRVEVYRTTAELVAALATPGRLAS